MVRKRTFIQAAVVFLLVLLFQNCTPAKFEPHTILSMPSKGVSPGLFQLEATETYDGKLTFYNYDLDLSCGADANGFPKVRFVFETIRRVHSISRGPCVERTGSPFLDALPLVGQSVVADSGLAWHPFNPNALVVHLLAFQTASSARDVGLIYELWKAEQFAVAPSEKSQIDFMLIRKPDGTSTLSFIASRIEIATGQLLAPPFLSPNFPMITLQTGSAIRHTAIVQNSLGVETGRVFLDVDSATPNSATSSSVGQIGYSGPFASSGIPIFVP